MEKIIPIDIYNTDMLFVIGTKDELKQSLNKYLEKEDVDDAYNVMAADIDDITMGRSAYLNSGQVVLWISNTKDKGTLAHEIFHVVCYIMEKVGISLCHESDEAYAYLIGFITNKVNDALNSSYESPLQ